jgi:release factor glutamine methyltransferase
MQAPRPHRLDTALRDARARVGAVDADALFAHVLGRAPGWLFAHGDALLDPDDHARIVALVERRARGEPVAYLTGRRGFWTLDLEVSPATLIPRPETELLVEQALARLPVQAQAVADLGTGTGAVALAIARERPRARVVATDASPAALAVARRNAAAAGIGNVEFHAGDWFAALPGRRFHLVASNPPYIAEGDPHLGQGDLRHEPRAALASGVDGLDDLRRIVADATLHLEPGGWLLLEHGHDQGGAVRALLSRAGLTAIETVVDLEARDRVSLGRLGSAG